MPRASDLILLTTLAPVGAAGLALALAAPEPLFLGEAALASAFLGCPPRELTPFGAEPCLDRAFVTLILFLLPLLVVLFFTTQPPLSSILNAAVLTPG